MGPARMDVPGPFFCSSGSIEPALWRRRRARPAIALRTNRYCIAHGGAASAIRKIEAVRESGIRASVGCQPRAERRLEFERKLEAELEVGVTAVLEFDRHRTRPRRVSRKCARTRQRRYRIGERRLIAPEHHAARIA